MVMLALFVGALVTGLLLLAFQAFLTIRHLIYLRRSAGSWREFFSFFNAERAREFSAPGKLSPGAFDNVVLIKRLNKLGLCVFGLMAIAFICGMLWGGWTGSPS
jgi:hypothetical protein